jgi:hypothetical protein
MCDPFNPPNDCISIHPNFILFVLANRPGFPFLGNDFFRECGDVFSVHIIDNLDLHSEAMLLQQYTGTHVHKDVVMKIAKSFSELRNMYGNTSVMIENNNNNNNNTHNTHNTHNTRNNTHTHNTHNNNTHKQSSQVL